MNRRNFLRTTLSLVPATLAHRVFLTGPDSSHEVQMRIESSRTIATIPVDFTGLGYEISSVARPKLLSPENPAYLQLVRTLGTRGVIRVGGNTADYASYSANAPALSSPETKAGSVVNDAVLRDFGGFLRATGWQMIWALNLGNRDQANAIEEAKAVSAAAGDHLLAFEIGNEPDLFARRHRPANYSYSDYLAEFRTFRDALRKVLPHVPFAAPDAAREIGWVTKFAEDEANRLKLLTAHYYRGGAKDPKSTIDELLHDDPKLGPMLRQLRTASESCGVPYRICETNSFFGGGKPGVSNTFASALWVLDFMFTLASAGCAGVNMETGVNQLGFISPYSPIADDEHGHYSAAPEYYGMLALKPSAGGRLLACKVDASGKNIKGYAVQTNDGLVLTLINKESAYDADFVITIDSSFLGRRASLTRLAAPSLESKSGVTLGGAMVSGDGSWKPTHVESFIPKRGKLQVHLPKASAAILEITPVH